MWESDSELDIVVLCFFETTLKNFEPSRLKVKSMFCAMHFITTNIVVVFLINDILVD